MPNSTESQAVSATFLMWRTLTTSVSERYAFWLVVHGNLVGRASQRIPL